eukprot:evm.model.scf_964EXC.6 EVM.evm.TU.scf_964EXC.6   scf_964EXC:29259-32100(+)
MSGGLRTFWRCLARSTSAYEVGSGGGLPALTRPGVRHLAANAPDDTVKGWPMVVVPYGRGYQICPDIIREDIARFFHSFDLIDIRPQYNSVFRPVAWWVRFGTDEERKRAMQLPAPRWGGRRVLFEEKGMREWTEGTYQHLVSQSFGCYVLVQRMPHNSTEADVASFFRSFHLQGHGVTLLHDAAKPNIREDLQFKRAIVRLISPEEAQRAARALHQRYMRNGKVGVKVLQ